MLFRDFLIYQYIKEKEVIMARYRRIVSRARRSFRRGFRRFRRR